VAGGQSGIKGDLAVIKSDHGHILGNTTAFVLQHLDGAERHAVVESEDRIGQGMVGEERGHGFNPAFIGKVILQHMGGGKILARFFIGFSGTFQTLDTVKVVGRAGD